MQVVALKTGDFLPIPQHAMHMAAAVGEPIGVLAVGAKSIESDPMDVYHFAGSVMRFAYLTLRATRSNTPHAKHPHNLDRR
jgi:hypothetical protein